MAVFEPDFAPRYPSNGNFLHIYVAAAPNGPLRLPSRETTHQSTKKGIRMWKCKSGYQKKQESIVNDDRPGRDCSKNPQALFFGFSETLFSFLQEQNCYKNGFSKGPSVRNIKNLLHLILKFFQPSNIQVAELTTGNEWSQGNAPMEYRKGQEKVKQRSWEPLLSKKRVQKRTRRHKMKNQKKHVRHERKKTLDDAWHSGSRPSVPNQTKPQLLR